MPKCDGCSHWAYNHQWAALTSIGCALCPCTITRDTLYRTALRKARALSKQPARISVRSFAISLAMTVIGTVVGYACVALLGVRGVFAAAAINFAIGTVLTYITFTLNLGGQHGNVPDPGSR